MPTVTMSMEEYLALMESLGGSFPGISATESHLGGALEVTTAPKAKKRISRYQRTYKREFKKVASRFQKKNGTWKVNGFRDAVKAAHRATKKALGQ